MRKLTRGLWIGGAVAAAALLVLAVTPDAAIWVKTLSAAEPEAAAEPAPPEGQGYTGSKRCSSCHFEQYMTWKKTKHSEAFNNLPAKYKAGAETKCFQCHITAYGHPQGYKGAETADLLGVTCESCHGPGSQHEVVAKQFAEAEKLTPEQEKQARDTIWKIMPGNICSTCHMMQGHKEHEEYEKEEGK
jgi:hypothetical protein